MNTDSRILRQALRRPLQVLAARHTLVMLPLKAESIMSDSLPKFTINFLTMRNPLQLPTDVFLVERFPKLVADPGSQAHSNKDLLDG